MKEPDTFEYCHSCGMSHIHTFVEYGTCRGIKYVQYRCSNCHHGKYHFVPLYIPETRLKRTPYNINRWIDGDPLVRVVSRHNRKRRPNAS